MKHLQTTDFYKMKIPTNHPHPYRNGKVGGVHQMKVTKPKYLENKDLQNRYCDIFHEKDLSCKSGSNQIL